MSEPTYKIIRFYREGFESKVLDTGLTLEEARAHCSSPEASSTTATNGEPGDWFDGYTEEEQ